MYKRAMLAAIAGAVSGFAGYPAYRLDGFLIILASSILIHFFCNWLERTK